MSTIPRTAFALSILTLLSATAAAQDAPADGCTSSADCKAGRACVGGACVAAPTAPTASPASAGCASDADCKAGRACANGACVPRTPATEGCASDADCKGERACVDGACRARDEEPGALGATCRLDEECSGLLSCVAGTCQTRKRKEASPGDGFRLSVLYVSGIGLAGVIKNAAPDAIIGIDASPGMLGFRYHFVGAFNGMNGHNGFRFEPLVFGFPIKVLDGRAWLEIEPAMSVLQIEGFANDKLHALTLGMSQHVSAHVIVKPLTKVVGTVGFGFEERYWSMVGDSRTTASNTAVGVNLLLRFAVGVNL